MIPHSLRSKSSIRRHGLSSKTSVAKDCSEEKISYSSQHPLRSSEQSEDNLTEQKELKLVIAKKKKNAYRPE